MKKILEEFRDFAIKGNMVDLAIGVIIGTAFNSIVNSLVNDIIMPVLSVIIGRINVTELKLTIPGLLDFPDITIKYGSFLQAVINFLVIAFSLFITVKFLNKIRGKNDITNREAAALTKSEKLLTEIRDILKEEKNDDE